MWFEMCIDGRGSSVQNGRSGADTMRGACCPHRKAREAQIYSFFRRSGVGQNPCAPTNQYATLGVGPGLRRGDESSR